MAHVIVTHSEKDSQCTAFIMLNESFRGIYNEQESVADAIFPRMGHQDQIGGRHPIIRPNFPENCMKMKKPVKTSH